MGGDLQQKLGVGFSQHDYRLVGVEFLDGFHQLFAFCETVIRACSLDGERVRRRHREGHFVGPEEEGHGTGYGAGDVVNPRSVVGIVRIVDQGLPIRVTDRLRVAVVVGFVNGRQKM